MSLPYSSYRDSNIPWVGVIPSHWRTANLKWLARRYSGGTPDKARLDYWEEGTIPWLNSGAVNDQRITTASAFITNEAFQNSSAKWIPSGSLVMALAGQGKTKGMVAQVMLETTCNQSMAAIIPSSECNAGYLFWWLTSNYQNIRNMAGGDLRDGLNLDLIGSIPCPLPEANEQAAIANFLDCETAKIDALIAEQEKLLALLAEKRQATISYTVTRGLDPNAPMKDSGVPWLGEVPGHWEVVPLKRDLAFLTSGSRGWAEHYADDGALFIRIGNLTRDSVELDLRDIKRVAPPAGAEGERTRVEPGDVLFSITAYLGSVAVVPEEFETAYVSQHVALARLRGERFLPKWVGYVTLSRLGTIYLASQGYGGTKVQLSLDDIACLPITVPPLAEQQTTLDFIEQELQRFERVRECAEAAICLLRERRIALITAAVTGKIDVRRLAERVAV